MEIEMDDKLQRLKALAEKADTIASYEIERKRNLKRLRELFEKLQLHEKVDRFDDLFDFNAVNLAGISLQPGQLGVPFEKKYAQIIAITKVEEGGKSRSKNINLRYFGRADTLDPALRARICEFVLRWRLEKSFRGVDRYRGLLKNLETPSN